MAAVFDTHANPFVLHGTSKCITQEIELHTTKDGEHISLGVNVYDENGEEYIIAGLGTEYVWGRKGDSRIYKQLEPQYLTRECPDSWEQLEEDLLTYPHQCGLAKATGLDCHQFDSCLECSKARVEALIRRTKALAGVE